MNEERVRAVADASALRLVGAAVTVAAKAAPTRRQFLAGLAYYRVPVEDMERLIEAARQAGFDIPRR